MVVRGALTIAIAATLSVAAETSKLEGFSGTPNVATTFLKNKLDNLVSSQPTTVNLSDDATKLTKIVTNSVATAADANQVLQVYIEAAEIMLEDDVASNKAIRAYGSSFIQNQLKDFKKLSILTYCILAGRSKNCSSSETLDYRTYTLMSNESNVLIARHEYAQSEDQLS